MMKKIFALSILFTAYSLIGQSIFTFAGTGVAGFSGDGGQAINAQFQNPGGIAIDALNNIYVADFLNHRLRKITPAGIISTIAGNGIAGSTGDGGPAVNSQLNKPFSCMVDAAGNIYVSEFAGNRVRMINTSGIISTFAGNGVGGFSGDGGLASNAQLNGPCGLTKDLFGNILIADLLNNRIRIINSSQIITTIAGTGAAAFGGDGGLAISAQFNQPVAVQTDNIGNIFICDQVNNCIRKINSSGIISTIAGCGNAMYWGDGGAAINACLYSPTALFFDASMNLYIADQGNQRIRMINSSGIITTAAGNGNSGYSGDGGLSTNAQLNWPCGLAISPSGNIYIADHFNQRIRLVCNASCVTSIHDLNTHSSSSLFPNPNEGTFIFNSEENGVLSIFNSIGQKVFEEGLSEGEANIHTRLSPGLYTCIFISSNLNKYIQKLIIK